MARIKNYKTHAWKQFSKFIRLKNSINGKAKCVTCPKTDKWENLQAGHFVDGRHNAVLYNEAVVFPQCSRCNIWLKGNKNEFMLFMIQRIGLEATKKLCRLKFAKTQKIDHKEVYEKYKRLNEIYENNV